MVGKEKEIGFYKSEINDLHEQIRGLNARFAMEKEQESNLMAQIQKRQGLEKDYAR